MIAVHMLMVVPQMEPFVNAGQRRASRLRLCCDNGPLVRRCWARSAGRAHGGAGLTSSMRFAGERTLQLGLADSVPVNNSPMLGGPVNNAAVHTVCDIGMDNAQCPTWSDFSSTSDTARSRREI